MAENFPKPESTKTQNANILAALKAGKRLTSAGAFTEFGCVRFSGRKFDLVNGVFDGNHYNIKTADVRDKETGKLLYYEYYLDLDEPILNEGQIGIFNKKAI